MIVRFGMTTHDGLRVWVEDSAEGRLRTRSLVESPGSALVNLAILCKTGSELIEKIEKRFLVEDKDEFVPAEHIDNRATVSDDGKRVSGAGFACQAADVLHVVMPWLKKAIEENRDTMPPETAKVSGQVIKMVRLSGRVEFPGGYIDADDMKHIVKKAGFTWPT